MKIVKPQEIEKLRSEIVEDNQLLPDQKEYTLARLDEKESALFPNIVRQAQNIAGSISSSMVGHVQLVRLKKRNECLREIGATFDNVAEIKKKIVRIQNLDIEIKAEQEQACKDKQEKEAAHLKVMAEHRFGKKEIEQKSEEADLQHSINKLKLEMELKALRKKQNDGDSKEKTLDEKLREIEEQSTLDRAEIEGALELRRIKQDFEQATERMENENVNLEKYERLRRQMKNLKEHGFDDDVIRQINMILDQEFGFNRMDED